MSGTQTPWGRAVAVYKDRNDFYDDYPHLELGWNLETHIGTAPLGADLAPGDRWLGTFCYPGTGPHEEATGVAIAFDHQTGEIHVLKPGVNFTQAEQLFQRVK